MILTVYRAEPLMDLTASMGHSLASDKELIFDLKVEANNWNWWTVRVQDADLSVFAFSDLLNTTFGSPLKYAVQKKKHTKRFSLFRSGGILGYLSAIRPAVIFYFFGLVAAP